MSKKKACRKCKIFVEGEECPICGTANFTNTWQGRLYIADAAKSEIAQKLGVKVKGEYAI